MYINLKPDEPLSKDYFEGDHKGRRELKKAGVEIMYPDKKKFENMVKPVYDYYRKNKEMDMLISQIKIQ